MINIPVALSKQFSCFVFHFLPRMSIHYLQIHNYNSKNYHNDYYQSDNNVK